MGNTILNVTNNSNEDVPIYVTFAAQNPSNECCPSPIGPKYFTFLTEVNELMGTFMLGAGKTQEFDPNGQCFSGNICFYIQPNCPVAGADFHHGKYGTNIAEFTLNPNGSCSEAIDISCVNGVNCFMQMTVDVDGGWTYGPKNISIDKIYNRGLQENSGLPGVYPVNCTDCIQLVGTAPCSSLPTGPAQTERICNLERSGRGGSVNVTLLNNVVIPPLSSKLLDVGNIIWVNNSAESLNLNWVDGNGSEIKIITLTPGESQTIGPAYFVGVNTIRDQAGNLVLCYVINGNANQTVTVSAEAVAAAKINQLNSFSFLVPLPNEPQIADFTVANNSKVSLNLYWLLPSGILELIDVLPAGNTTTLAGPVYFGSILTVSDLTGKLVLVYVATETTTQTLTVTENLINFWNNP